MEAENAKTALRPNIRIEIKNNLIENMDTDMEVDKGINSEEEEGEIMDSTAGELSFLTSKDEPITAKVVKDKIEFDNGFDKNEQKKLLDRAKRFQLDVNIFGEENLIELYETLGVKGDNENDVRFEAIHMLGESDMSTEEVLKYFGKYGPLGIEWISDNCCNIVWSDKISAARALYFLSKPIKEMPVIEESDAHSSEIDDEQNLGKSVLLRNKHREIEVKDYDEEVNKENVSKKDIKIPIPPGFWRAGKNINNSQYFLLRFAFKSDKKAYKAERFSDYYKKEVETNYNGKKGLISASRKLQARSIFDRNQEIMREPESIKNPWGRLAENWYEDVKYAEPEYKQPIINSTKASSSALQHRLGFKRAHKSEEKEKLPENTVKKSKVPRMRMYADEEEEKIKRKLQLKALAASTAVKLENDPEDLRNSLRKTVDRDPKLAINNVTDLGIKLKNRKLKQLLQIEDVYSNRMPFKIDSYNNIRVRVEDRENSSGTKMNTKHSYFDKPEIRKTLRTSPKRSSHEHRHSRSKKIRSTTSYEDESDYDDDYDYRKTNSKVTVVIKKQKTPAVASTVWAPMHSDREKQKKTTKRESSSSSSSSESTSSDSESDSDIPMKIVDRPGFKNKFQTQLLLNPSELESPLRIEINNDHFKN